MTALGWHELDVILISGDSYIDSPYSGVAVIGKVLQKAVFRVGIIAQPELTSDVDISRLGEPKLFWGVSGGTVDSMVANYTATLRKRRSDDFTPGGENNRRPDRAVIAYTNLIKRVFKNTKPIVLGGIEASLRRVAHYDYWSDSIRRSILFDAKADYLLFGMAEQSILELAKAIRAGTGEKDVRGLCYISRDAPEGESVELPSYEDVIADKTVFINMFHEFYRNNDPLTAKRLIQRHGDRLLVQNPPALYLSQQQMDAVAALPFQRRQQPYYEKQGPVRAMETIQFSINTHRGCYGECNFCAIAVHEGRTIRSRSIESLKAEAEAITRHPDFKGIIQDLGGPTANMYEIDCRRKFTKGACDDKRCLFPTDCSSLRPNHLPQINLLKTIRGIP